MSEENTAIVGCLTCLYMATHEKCDGCLSTEEDDKAMRDAYKTLKVDDKKPVIPFRYLHYKEGNWMERVTQREIDGTRNIVIGGQGEAEVNTKWTPQETSEHLHDVSEQCGYFTGSLHSQRDDTEIALTISTTEGQYKLVWEGTGISHLPARLLRIEPIGKVMFDWKWSNVNPWRKTA